MKYCTWLTKEADAASSILKHYYKLWRKHKDKIPRPTPPKRTGSKTFGSTKSINDVIRDLSGGGNLDFWQGMLGKNKLSNTLAGLDSSASRESVQDTLRAALAPRTVGGTHKPGYMYRAVEHGDDMTGTLSSPKYLEEGLTNDLYVSPSFESVQKYITPTSSVSRVKVPANMRNTPVLGMDQHPKSQLSVPGVWTGYGSLGSYNASRAGNRVTEAIVPRDQVRKHIEANPSALEKLPITFFGGSPAFVDSSGDLLGKVPLLSSTVRNHPNLMREQLRRGSTSPITQEEVIKNINSNPLDFDWGSAGLPDATPRPDMSNNTIQDLSEYYLKYR